VGFIGIGREWVGVVGIGGLDVVGKEVLVGDRRLVGEGGDFVLFFEMGGRGALGFGWVLFVDRVLGAENQGRVGVCQAAVAFGIVVLGVGRLGHVLLGIFDLGVIFALCRFEIL
jgi:hypothetical protein